MSIVGLQKVNYGAVWLTRVFMLSLLRRGLQQQVSSKEGQRYNQIHALKCERPALGGAGSWSIAV